MGGGGLQNVFYVNEANPITQVLWWPCPPPYLKPEVQVILEPGATKLEYLGLNPNNVIFILEQRNPCIFWMNCWPLRDTHQQLFFFFSYNHADKRVASIWTFFYRFCSRHCSLKRRPLLCAMQSNLPTTQMVEWKDILNVNAATLVTRYLNLLQFYPQQDTEMNSQNYSVLEKNDWSDAICAYAVNNYE